MNQKKNTILRKMQKAVEKREVQLKRKAQKAHEEETKVFDWSRQYAMLYLDALIDQTKYDLCMTSDLQKNMYIYTFPYILLKCL